MGRLYTCTYVGDSETSMVVVVYMARYVSKAH